MNTEDPVDVVRMSPFSALQLDKDERFVASLRAAWSTMETKGTREAIREAL
ncbi:hypothetical protein [Burkholderia aenigmatica]|uniref:hypothetical protein n=1 Tax=Burkholderia aenigmatica TaxID=2015348 RepID=UPI0015C660D5|nr:hypothetical protein [Burkholderia aenigmatica]